MKKHKYMRVGIQIYKQTFLPQAYGEAVSILAKWNKETMKMDGLEAKFKSMPKYDGFCNIPNHIDYKQVIDNHYNKYHKINYKPKQGNCDNTLRFIEHVFGEQYELGLDYLKLLLKKPWQKLPILCLVSAEERTGKSTFTQFIKLLFEANAIYLDNESLNSNFNSGWVGSLVAMIEETLLTKRNHSERLKNISTAFNYQIESKGVDRIETQTFTKFILCSNNENDLVIIKPGESRYWIRKLNPFEIEDPNFLSKLEAERQHFFYFLQNREYSTQCENRMWFNPKVLITDALLKVMRFSRNKNEKQLLDLFSICFDDYEMDTVKFRQSDVFNWIFTYYGKQLESSQIKDILHNEWRLKPQDNSKQYTKITFHKDGSIETTKFKGRYYTLSLDTYKKMMI